MSLGLHYHCTAGPKEKFKAVIYTSERVLQVGFHQMIESSRFVQTISGGVHSQIMQNQI